MCLRAWAIYCKGSAHIYMALIYLMRPWTSTNAENFQTSIVNYIFKIAKNDSIQQHKCFVARAHVYGSYARVRARIFTKIFFNVNSFLMHLSFKFRKDPSFR